jgi:hypothetical protein
MCHSTTAGHYFAKGLKKPEHHKYTLAILGTCFASGIVEYDIIYKKYGLSSMPHGSEE